MSVPHNTSLASSFQGMSETLLVVGIKADDIPEVTEIVNVQLDSIEPSDTQRLRPGSTFMTIIINANDNPAGALQFSPRMNLSYAITVSSHIFLKFILEI